MKILVINGPNLNLLGKREPELYGSRSLADINGELQERCSLRGVTIEFFQSNHEGAIVDRLQAAPSQVVDGIIINPGGLAHTSVSLRDCLAGIGLPAIEVHLTNIYAREEFRRNSMLSPVCKGVIAGFGPLGYRLALEYFVSSQ